MRSVPGTADARQRAGSADALSAPPMTASMDCFITTEEALADSGFDAADPSPLRASRSFRKRSIESLCQDARGQLPSPAPTGISIASVSSSALDSELDLEDPSANSPLMNPGASARRSRTASVASSASLGASSLGPSSPRRRARSATPSSDSQSRRDAASQFIMPSLSVPQRRPFSEAGKSVGKLKVLVAGRPGIGKTSLIHAISYCCEHIVHIDPVSVTSQDEFSELWASTKPRPWWRGELDLSGSRKRRRSSTGEILERNLCFVVKSAFHRPTSHTAEKDYVDAHLSPLLEKPVDDSDLWTILSGGGASIVDVVFYLIPHTGLDDRDVECIKSLQAKTNIIPLLARSDELDATTISEAKQHIRQQIDEHGLDCFSFVAQDTDVDATDVFSVSSATQADYDMMDASVLMSSGYVQPLIATDLAQLVDKVFSADGCAWLRHAAAAKCIQWRREQDHGLYLDMALTRRDPASRAVSIVLTANPFIQPPNWDRVEISNWAQGLRHSLLTEKMDRVTAQQLVAATGQGRQRLRDMVRREGARHRDRRARQAAAPSLAHQDPLGLLRMASQMKRHGRMTLELLSSLGILGGIATWLFGSEYVCPQPLRQITRDIFVC